MDDGSLEGGVLRERGEQCGRRHRGTGVAEDVPQDRGVVGVGGVGGPEASFETQDVGGGRQVFGELFVEEPGVAGGDGVALFREVPGEEGTRLFERRVTRLGAEPAVEVGDVHGEGRVPGGVGLAGGGDAATGPPAELGTLKLEAAELVEDPAEMEHGPVGMLQASGTAAFAVHRQIASEVGQRQARNVLGDAAGTVVGAHVRQGRDVDVDIEVRRDRAQRFGQPRERRCRASHPPAGVDAHVTDQHVDAPLQEPPQRGGLLGVWQQADERVDVLVRHGQLEQGGW
jgi:hypothetical protein